MTAIETDYKGHWIRVEEINSTLAAEELAAIKKAINEAENHE